MTQSTLKPAADRENSWSQFYAGGLILSQLCLLWSLYHLATNDIQDWRFTAILGTLGLISCLIGQNVVYWHKARFTPPGLYPTLAGFTILLPTAIAGVGLFAWIGYGLILVGLFIFIWAYWHTKLL